MKRFLCTLLLLIPLSLSAAETGNIVEIEVKGMTCPFCVYGLRSSLTELDGVKNCEVSLENNKARIEMEEGQVADLDKIQKIITNSGFTPGEVRVIHCPHQSLLVL